MAKDKTSEVVIEGRKVLIKSGEFPKLPAWTQTRVVGKSAARVDARPKVTGNAMFTTDVVLPNMAHARFIRSARTHAKITAIDTSTAEAVPGFLAVATPAEWSDKFLKDPLGRGLPILTDEPKYFGEEILSVCAETEDAARAAAAKIRVTYEDLPHVLDPEEAVRMGRFVGGGWQRTQPGKPNIYRRGDIKKGMAASAKIFERTYRTAPTSHCSLEPHAAVASYENGQWKIWESTQGVFAVREELAELLGAALPEVRVIGTYMGGGFGGKVAAGKYTFAAAYFSKKLGRPVRFVQDRSEEFVSPYGRPPSIQTLRIGVRADGKIVAIEQKGIHAVGAYEFGAEWGHAEDMITEMYDCPNLYAESYAALTNIPPPCAMRAPGFAQAAFALEQMMDEIAHAMGMDPVELRLKNLPDKDPDSGRPYAAPRGTHGLRECLKIGAELFGWSTRKKSKAASSSDTSAPSGNGGDTQIRKGVGVAATIWGGGGGPPAACLVRVHADGTADVLAGAADIGTGTRTVLAQIAAEELGLRVEDIRITNADTELTMYTLPSYGSFTIASSGPAVRRAAYACRQEILAMAANVLETPEKNIVLENGRATRPGTRKKPEEFVAISKLVSLSPAKEIVGHGEREPNPKLALKSYGVQFVAVSVEMESGKIWLDELVAVNESGRVINRRTFESQQIGGATMGLGMALLEERVYDAKTGKILNPNLSDYKVPIILDQPEIFRLGMAQIPYEANAIGAKGLGEPPIIPTSPAVANAVCDAAGVRLTRLPLSRKRLIDAIRVGTTAP